MNVAYQLRESAKLIVCALLLAFVILWAGIALHGWPRVSLSLPRGSQGYVRDAEVFVGWLERAAVVTIRFPNGGHVSYGGEQLKKVTKELKGALKGKNCK